MKILVQKILLQCLSYDTIVKNFIIPPNTNQLSDIIKIIQQMQRQIRVENKVIKIKLKPQPQVRSTKTSQKLYNSIVDECYHYIKRSWWNQYTEDQTKQKIIQNFKKIQCAGKLGNTRAQFLMGRYYNLYQAKNNVNTHKSKEWYMKAYKKGQIYCIYDLFNLQQQKNRKKKLLLQAVNKKDPRALVYIANQHLYGYNQFQINQKLGLEYLKIVLDLHYPDAYEEMGLYSYHKFNFEEAIQYLQKAYKTCPTMYKQLEAYIGSANGDLDRFQQAQKWLKHGINSKGFLSLNMLASQYIKLDRNKQAKKLLEQSIFIQNLDQIYCSNLCQNYFYLGQLYKIQNNIMESVKLYQLGAKLEDWDCYAALGKMYFQGNGVQRDQEKGRAMIIKASSKDSQQAKRIIRAHNI